MTETTADNRPQPLDTGPIDTGPSESPTDTGPSATEPTDTQRKDPLDSIAAELDELAALDPAEAVDVLADITAELNKELDADTDRS